MMTLFTIPMTSLIPNTITNATAAATTTATTATFLTFPMTS